jgi:cytidine deaminase
MMSSRVKAPIPVEWRDLYQSAVRVQKNAYAPYSAFPVGAAIQSKFGVIYNGCNIENASSGLTVCAERVAIWVAIAAGEHDFTHLVVVTEDGSPPCGACRQVLYEFAPDLEILVADTQSSGYVTTLAILLPDAFSLRR